MTFSNTTVRHFSEPALAEEWWGPDYEKALKRDPDLRRRDRDHERLRDAESTAAAMGTLQGRIDERYRVQRQERALARARRLRCAARERDTAVMHSTTLKELRSRSARRPVTRSSRPLGVRTRSTVARATKTADPDPEPEDSPGSPRAIGGAS